MTIHNPAKLANPRGKDQVIRAVQDAIKKVNADSACNFSIQIKKLK